MMNLHSISRNERFKRGGKATLLYNPVQILTGETVLPTTNDYPDRRYLNLKNIGTDLVGFGYLMAVNNEFGGEITSDGIGNNQILVSGDTFFDRDIFEFLENSEKTFYLFPRIQAPEYGNHLVEDCLITSLSTTYDVAKFSEFNMVYKSNEETRIKLLFPLTDFDQIMQIVMSPALAIMSCDDDYGYTDAQIGGQVLQVPLGGGSVNPIVRMAVLVDKDISIDKSTRKFELTFKLLG